MVAPDPFESVFESWLSRIEAEGPRALEVICREHPEHSERLRQRVALLLGFGLLGQPPDRQDSFPERLGDFRLLQRLGGGGMGVVFLARQETLRREVALKLIRPDLLYFPGARERFQREVEVVARMQHPGIVPIYCFGEDRGLPYFAMERLDGCTIAELLERLAGRDPRTMSASDAFEEFPPLDRPRDSRSAGTWVEMVLRMVRQIAEALDHAHGRGVLHRDVKPSNIWLTPSGRALLLDFGLASLPSAVRITRTDSRPGSLPYMSPEQLRGEPLDARSDVYSLGVTLYELLTLSPAFSGVDGEAMRQRILRGDVVPLRQLHRGLAWDVATVCSSAMDPDPNRRYATAGDFVRDLGNVLDRRPIEGRRPGCWLRIVRWAQRHPTATAAGVVALGLATFGSGLLAFREKELRSQIEDRNQKVLKANGEAVLRAVQARQKADEASKAAEEAHQVTALLLRVFEARDPRVAGANLPTVKEVFDRGVRRVRAGLKDQPLVLAALLNTIGIVYRNLGLFQEAEPLLREALSLRRRELGSEHLKVAESLEALGLVLRSLGDHREAEELYREALTIGRKISGHGTAFVLRVQGNLAVVLANMDRLDEAEGLLRETLKVRGDESPVELESVSTMLTNLGDLLRRRGRFSEAEPLLVRAVELKRALNPAPHPDVAVAIGNHAVLLVERGCPREGAVLLHEAIYQLEAVFHDPHPTIPEFMSNYAVALHRLGQRRGSEIVFWKTIDCMRASTGGGHPQLNLALGNLAKLFGDQARLDEAEALCRESLQAARSRYGESSLEVACSTLNLAAVLKDKQAFEESEPLLRMALPVLEQENPDAFAACLNNLAGILEKTGRPEEARRLYERALVIRRSYWGADHPEVATTLNNFGLFLLSRREYPGAELLLREGVAIRRDRLSKDDPLLATSLNNLGYLLACKGDHAGAVPWFREALAIRRRMLGSCRETVEAVVNLALQLAELKEWNEAELLLKEAVEWCRARGLNEEYWLNLRRLVRLTMLANRLPAALEAARDLVRFCRDRRPVVARELGQALNYLGRILTRHGNPREAEPLLEEGLRLLHEGDSIDSLLARVSLGACKSELGRHAEAEELLLEALRIVRGLKNADDRPEAAVARELVRLYERWNKPERAAEYRSLAERSTGPEPRGRTK